MESFGRYVQVTLERDIYGSPTEDGELLYQLYGLGGIEHATADVYTERILRVEELKLSPDLKCEFRFRTGKKGLEGSIKVFNLSKESRDFPYGGYNGTRGVRLILDAGYVDNHSPILQCSLSEIREYRKGPDLITEYIIGTHQTIFSKADGSITYDRPLDLYKIIKSVLDRNEVPYVDGLKADIDAGNTNYLKLMRDDFVFVGTAKQLLDAYIGHIYLIEKDILELYQKPPTPQGKTFPPVWTPNGIKYHQAAYFIDQLGVIYLYWENDNRPLKPIVLITSETGIIGMPTIKRKNVKDRKLELRHILVPQLTKMTTIRVSTSGRYTKLEDGDYLISNAEYIGSNYGGKHEVVMELSPPPKFDADINESIPERIF